jgi:hypothetical protein
MAAFSHQRFRCLAPVYRKLAVIHQTLPTSLHSQTNDCGMVVSSE